MKFFVSGKQVMYDKNSIIAQIDKDIKQVFDDMDCAGFTFEEPEWQFEDEVVIYYSRKGYFVSIKEHVLVIKWF